jgi:ATP adenylyltransferase
MWAPWRLDYIKAAKEEGCVFCVKPAQDDDESTYIVHRGDESCVILNAFPYNNGHVMVAPFEHVASLEDLGEAAMLEMMTLTQRLMAVLRTVYGPEGFNIGANLGSAAGAGVGDHLHLHVVPRWSGDTNFMPVIGSTRVLPQSLADSYRALRTGF